MRCASLCAECALPLFYLLTQLASSRRLLLWQATEMLACSRESHKNNRLAVLRSDHSIASYDIATARLGTEVCAANRSWHLRHQSGTGYSASRRIATYLQNWR